MQGGYNWKKKGGSASKNRRRKRDKEGKREKEGIEIEKKGVDENKFLLDRENVLEQMSAEFVLFSKFAQPNIQIYSHRLIRHRT